MRIREAELKTGLSRKTIRLYEARGLLRVDRSENSYREYDDTMIAQLRTIALLRRAGISLSDIQLWQDQVISTAEMLKKRLTELKNTAVLAEDQVRLCRQLLEGLEGDRLPDYENLPSEEHGAEGAMEDDDTMADVTEKSRLVIGIDIGTTTISAVVLDMTAGTPAGVYTVANDAAILSENTWDRRQDVGKIMDRVRKLLDALLGRFPQVLAIGFTGQMHGILYLDSDGNVLSPLYTWQDGRADLVEDSGKNICTRLYEETGCRLSAGYGLATHAYLQQHGSVPAGASLLCTVMDYAAAAFCGTKPVCHASNAASLGFFLVSDNSFDCKALKKAGIDPALLPKVISDGCVLGTYRGIPITVAIGDNQASVYGSIGERCDSVLANFGTGSQISMICSMEEVINMTQTPEIEIRPFLEHTVLLSGSALCGGRAYAAAERFFRAYATACGLSDTEQYEIMNKLALRGIERTKREPEYALRMETTFCGTRSDSQKRGSITNIGEDNFSPELLLAGVLTGMAEELYGMFLQMKPEKITHLAASGNAVRKNEALRLALASIFSMKPEIPVQYEEAAYGAAMFAAKTALNENKEVLESCIRYQTI